MYDLTEATPASEKSELALDISGLCKTYGNAFEALKGIDLKVAPGDFFALLGPNGAGKSTTIGILCSLVRKSAGQVRIFGHDIDREFSAAKQLLGLVPQEFNFNMFENIKDIVTNQAGYYGLPKALAEARAEKYLKHLGLWEKRNQQARNLSGGMKRRLMIARALVHEPKLLILDEPTAGVDIELRRSMWEFLKDINEAGTTIILTTHYLEEAESLCRNVAIINHGEIVENTSVKALLKQLNRETFILDVAQPVESLPQFDTYAVEQTDTTTLEVSVASGTSMNDLFRQLSTQGIDVISLRNKVNRLEELFVRLVNAQSSGGEE
ncbi:ABC transporter ATP-binding protein [Teredinibacter franksiae]|uniref:ABC transporter ATP-binding protein n=1 Tax=Teredinibacter franksiae TaxID=2761453 RepID=UPI00162AAED7|nr:ABC transporter ATP-binding protein [Teredinibacter franksiae]